MYIERYVDQKIVRLWLSLQNNKAGKLKRTKCVAYVRTNTYLKEDWTPISLSTTSIALKSNIIHCKRKQFPLVESCAITIHKSQGGTYDSVVYEYNKTHDQQLVYVALSRATSLEGLFLTNSEGDNEFHHARGRKNQDLQTEFCRLEQHKLQTLGECCRSFISMAPITICNLNVQSLRAHSLDISTDPVLSKILLLLLTETWMQTEESISISGFRLLTNFKRIGTRSGGVAIYINENSAITELFIYRDITNVSINCSGSSHNVIGDICAIEATIHDQKIAFISIYISPNSSLTDIKHFLKYNLMPYSVYSLIYDIIRKIEYQKMPIILSGDFNLNFNTNQGADFIEFMQTAFQLSLASDCSISTTRADTCIDAIFIRYVENFSFKHYCSYFSYHKAILGKIDNFRN